MPTRRAFLAAAAAFAAAPLRGQEKPARLYRVGVLDALSPGNEGPLQALRDELSDAGFESGRNLVLEYRSAAGRPESLPALAAELVRLKVDCMVVNGTQAALAAKAAGGIPVVAALALDPVQTGLAASLEKPGGSVTGVAVLTPALEKKRVELLRALAPGRKRVALLVNMGNPALRSTLRAMQAAAAAIGMEPMSFEVRDPREVPQTIARAKKQGAQALIVRVGPLDAARRQALIVAAAEHALPAIYAQRGFVEAGGMASYGFNLEHNFALAAEFVAKVLEGANPGELGMEQPSKFELVINRRTMRALGLVIPPDLLLRSDDVVG